MTVYVSDSPARREPSLSHLLVLELDQVSVVLDDLVALVLARLEKLGQSKPLPSHLVTVIGVDTELRLACCNTHSDRGLGTIGHRSSSLLYSAQLFGLWVRRNKGL